MSRFPDPNLPALEAVVLKLGNLADEFVFVGGAVVGLLITDPGAAEIRPTLDVDALVEVASRSEYYRVQEKLRQRGFKEDIGGNVICRWKHANLIIDVMPTEEGILGFTNRWYRPAMVHAQAHEIGDLTIRVVSAPYFLGTKFEAFLGRGKGDYYGSADLEDLVAVVDGREELVDEVRGSAQGLQTYLSGHLSDLMALTAFREALPGYLPHDQASQARLPILENRLREIIGSK